MSTHDDPQPIRVNVRADGPVDAGGDMILAAYRAVSGQWGAAAGLQFITGAMSAALGVISAAIGRQAVEDLIRRLLDGCEQADPAGAMAIVAAAVAKAKGGS